MQFLHQNTDFTCSHFNKPFIKFDIYKRLFLCSSDGTMVSWIRISVALKKVFLWSLKKCKLARNAKETSKFQNGL